MSLRGVLIQKEYRSLATDVAKNFYVPLLSEAVLYKRAVGFFSSTSLIELSYGIGKLVKNGGKIELIASPKLSEEDIEAMNRGFELREKIIGDALMRELYEVDDYYEQERLNLLANLIAEGHLDIKIAFIDKNNNIGMYHEKMGIIEDCEGNKVAFSGSMNESHTAMKLNYESIDTYTSWGDDWDRVETKERAFNNLWTGIDEDVTTMRFPDVEAEIINRFKMKPADFELDEITMVRKNKTVICDEKWIIKPDDIIFYDYQQRAIENWQDNNFQGIFDMATGTGKTLTALGALEKLSEAKERRVTIIVVCPYQHLVEQWVEDITKFSIKPIVCYSSYKWKRDMKNAIFELQLGIEDHIFVVTTNATFATSDFQERVREVPGEICLVIDEAHNFGASKLSSLLYDRYDYRLALSATLERHRDEIGTKKLIDFFGEKCIEYDLARAIEEDKLTPYYYYPIEIHLEEDELEEYIDLSNKIVKSLGGARDDDDINKSTEMLLIKRARIIAGARQKVKVLKNLIRDQYIDKKNMLIYCGATSSDYSTYIEGIAGEDDKRQIDIVLRLLGNDLGMRVTKFTSEENSSERENIKKSFIEGSMLQAIVAIRCLDEGVNIPGITTVFILASSTNPKEYIQRRGRVLRKSKGKDYAKIYDFITLPRKLEEVSQVNENKGFEVSLIKREFSRVDEFSHLAENPSESLKLKERINNYYNIYNL